MDDDTIIGELRDLRCELAAHYTVLLVLCVKAGLADPAFEETVRRHVDITLGKRVVARGGIPDEREAKIREYVMDIIDVAKMPPSLPKKLTWRRRFLNWLARE
jgi:hypothetical protein